MSKYKPLQEHLQKSTIDYVRLSFKDIEQVLGFKLPPSARKFQAWWANEVAPRSGQQRSWLDAGWNTQQLDLSKEEVTFVRGTTMGSSMKKKPNINRTKNAIISTTLDSEISVTVRISWMHIGNIEIDRDNKLIFPAVSPVPGLYRFTLEKMERPASYIGETMDLRRRFQHYRTPGISQQTNVRLNDLLKSHLKTQHPISVSIVIDPAFVQIEHDERRLNIASKAERILAEHAALLAETDLTILNKAVEIDRGKT